MEISKEYNLPVLISDCKPFQKNCQVYEEKWTCERRGQKRVGYSIKEIVHERKTTFQNVRVLDSYTFGRILTIDGVIQLTEFDEFAYHEMLAFTTLACHPNPRKVLIVGGGDGGLVREVLKFPTVETVTLCEIDAEMIEVCETYFPSVSKQIRHPKVKLIIQDGFDFLTDPNVKHSYDVIICDSCDPGESGPQESLTREKFYVSMRDALLPNGIVCTQLGTNMWQREPVSEYVIGLCKKLFPVTRCLFLHVPAFSFCQNGCIISSINERVDFCKPHWKFSSEELDKMDLKFYNAKVHSAALALPRFAEKYFEEIKTHEENKLFEHEESVHSAKNGSACSHA